MNVVLYAGDSKYYSVLEPIAKELSDTSHNYLFYFTKSTQLLIPSITEHKDLFDYVGQSAIEEYHVSDTLQIAIPFKPDVLLIARERWQPEQSIIHEFKNKWNCKVGCVEVSSHLMNNIENRLEMLSRYNYPQNQIDYFFEHSEWAKERRIDCLDESFREKIIVCGNTRTFVDSNTQVLVDKYNIDFKKQRILFWGVINTTRNVSLRALKLLREKTKDTHQIFYKCYPGEPFNDKFRSDFNPFIVEGVQVIYDDNDIFGMSELCDTHVALASSAFNFAFANNKKIINLDSVCNASQKMNDFSIYSDETNNGVEDSAKFWMNVWGITSIEDFKKFIDLSRIDTFNKTNTYYTECVRRNTIDFDWDLDCLNAHKKDYSELLTYFDSYNLDKNAPKRILNFLTNEIR